MEWFKVKTIAGERGKLESTSTEDAEMACKALQVKPAKVCHILKRCPQFRIIANIFSMANYFERVNPFSKVGWLGKCLNGSVSSVYINSYVAIEDTLRARTADFIEQAYGEEVCFIDMIENEE
jgi:hypothetical protein